MWWKKYKLDSVHVVVTYKVWLRPPEDFQSKEHEEFTKNAEQDHISDYKKWWNPTGKDAAKKKYKEQKKFEYDNKKECERLARVRISSELGNSFRPALKESGRKWDKSGKHTWNPNKAKE